MSSFIMNTELFIQAMKSLQKLTGASAFGFVQFSLRQKQNALHIHAVNAGTSAEFLVSTTKILDAGKKTTQSFALEFQTLLTALAGHKSVRVTVKAGSVEFLSGKYKAELNRVAIHGDEEEGEEKQEEEKKPESSDAETVIPKDITEFIRTHLNQVSIDPVVVSTVGPPIPFGCIANEKGVFIAAYDNYHMSFVRTKKVVSKENLQFTLPLTSLSLLLKEFTGGKPLTMAVSQSILTAKNSVFRIKMALPAMDDRNVIPLDSVKELAASLTKDAAKIVKIDVAGTKQVLSNLKSIANKGDSLLFSVEGTDCKITSKGQRGRAIAQVSTETKHKKPLTFSVDFYAFENLTTKMTGANMELYVLDNVLFITSKGAIHMVALHADQK